jgi:hypothetical protein
VLLTAALVAAWLGSRKRPDAATGRAAAELEDWLARDDQASLERVVSRAAGSASGDALALGALAQLWLADDALVESAPLVARVHRLERMLRLETEAREPGWERRRDEIGSRLARARMEAEPFRDRAGSLLDSAAATAASARAAGASQLALLRIQALRQALLDDPGLGSTVRQASALDASDPWVELARNLAGNARGNADLEGLERLSATSPRILRSRLLLARAFRATGRDGDAVRVLDEVLAENGDHQGAKLLKAEVLSPPEAAVSRVERTSGAPPQRAGGYLPRLKPRT